MWLVLVAPHGRLVTTRHTYRCRHLSPLQNHVLGDPSIRVYVNPLVFVAHQKLHSIRVGEDNDCMGFDATLNLEERNREALSVVTSSARNVLSKTV